MINIYDVVLNFNKNFYEVYEWNNTDNIVNIRKLPIFKVSDEILINFKYNDIILSNNSLEYLINNTFFYKDIELKEINIIVTNGKCAIGLNFDNKGVLLGRSAMLFDEESEVLMESKNIKKTNFEFIVNKYITPVNSRIEYEKKLVLQDFINKTDDKLILQYIYYDYYLEECNNTSLIKQKIQKELSKEIDERILKLYNLITLLLNT